MSCWLSFTGMFGFVTSVSHYTRSSYFHVPIYVRIFDSALQYARSIGFHVLAYGRLGACSALHPSNRLLLRKLEVSAWVVNRPNFDPFSELSTPDLVPPDISMNLHIYTTLQGGLVLWYPLYPVAAIRFIEAVPFIDDRRYRLPEQTTPPPPLSEGPRRTASN